MLPNILFKVISNDPVNKSMVVKFCRENAQKSIDEYRSYNISYRNIDFSSPKAFEDSYIGKIVSTTSDTSGSMNRVEL